MNTKKLFVFFANVSTLGIGYLGVSLASLSAANFNYSCECNFGKYYQIWYVWVLR